MYHHIKKLMYTVRVAHPIPISAKCSWSSLAAPTANWRQPCNIQSRASTARTRPARTCSWTLEPRNSAIWRSSARSLACISSRPERRARAADADPLIAICGGGGVNLYNSQGDPWTADYLKVTGELDVDLRSNIAAEARAKIVYERLINFTTDPGTKDALQFLMTREITHMKAFAAALESMGKDPFTIGQIPPTAGLVDQYFNDSTDQGDAGQDFRGPWNQGSSWQYVESPAFRDLRNKTRAR